MRAWRNAEAHRAGQAEGRGGVLRDYRLRVATVLRDYGLNDREQAPTDRRQRHRHGLTESVDAECIGSR